MTNISDQLRTLKDNWLLIGIALVALLIAAGAPTSFTSTPQAYAEDTDLRGASGATTSDRRVEETSRLSLATPDVQRVMNDAETTIDSYGATILNQREHRDSGDLERATYQINVAYTNQTALVDELRSLGTVTSYDVNRQDITESYQTTTEELSTEREKLQRLRELYNQSTTEQRADLIDRVIDQERRVRELERQLSSLDDRTTTSTVYLTINKETYLDTSFVTINDLANNVVASTSTMVSWLASLLPWIIIGGLAYLAYKRRTH